MDSIEAIKRRRTIRRFGRKAVDRDILVELVDLARLAPSTINLQPLEFIVVDDAERLREMFPLVKLGALLPEDQRPKADEGAAAYIVILVNTDILKAAYERDVGAAVENILLGGFSHGLGSAFIWSVDRDSIRNLFGIPENYAVDCVVALGHPAEESVAVEMMGGDTRYWRDEDGTHRVPKRTLESVLHVNGY
jgi:nitroreductase